MAAGKKPSNTINSPSASSTAVTTTRRQSKKRKNKMPNIVVDTTDRSKSLYYNISKYIFSQFFTDEDLGINANLMLQKISAKAKLRRTKIVNFWTRYGEKFCLAFGRELDKKDTSLQVEITPAIFCEELLIKVDHETIQRLILGIGGELNTQVIYINNQRQECPFSMHVFELCDLLRQVHTTNEMMTDLYEIVFKVIQSYGNDMTNIFTKKLSDAERATVASMCERVNASVQEQTKKKSTTTSATKRKASNDDDVSPAAKQMKRERETTDEDEEDEEEEDEEAESVSDKSVEVVEDVIASSPTDDVVGQLIPGNLPEIKPLNIPRSNSSTNSNTAITSTSSGTTTTTTTTTTTNTTEAEKKKTAEEEEEEEDDDDVAL